MATAATMGDRAPGFVDRWLSASPYSDTPAVRDGLLRSMVEAPLPMTIAFLWIQLVAASGLALTKHPAFAAWIAIDAALTLARVCLQGHFADAIARHALPPVRPLLGVIVLQYCAMAVGIVGLMCAPRLEALMLAVLLAIAFSGLVGSRFAAVPRFAALLIGLVTAALSIGFFLSPYPGVAFIGIMLPASAMAFSLLAWQNHKVLVDALKAQETNRRLSLHDALTGLPNRLQLHQRLAQACRDYRPKHSGAQHGGFAVLCMDLDGFKPVNDRLGHAAGDLVLQEIAHRLPAQVGPDAVVSRIGGDEFVALLFTTDLDEIRATAARMIEACRSPLDIGGKPVTVGLSIGITIAAAPIRLNPDIDGERLLREADDALYVAKREQRGTWRIHGAGER